MARKNRYTGVLKPTDIGRGSPEVSCFLIYDIENDRLRTRAADICLNYGLDRIQFSAFFGKLNRNRRQELCLRLQRELGDRSARVRIIPVCQDDLKDMWVLDQYRVEEEADVAGAYGAAAGAGGLRSCRRRGFRRRLWPSCIRSWRGTLGD